MLKPERDYTVKVPAEGDRCSRCAMTNADRKRHQQACPLADPVADLCPYHPKLTRRKTLVLKGKP